MHHLFPYAGSGGRFSAKRQRQHPDFWIPDAGGLPRDEQERATLMPLFDACVQHSRSGAGSVLTSEAIELETADGKAYLVCFYEVPTGPSVKISHHLLPDFGNRRMGPGRVGFGTRYFLIFARLTRAALWMTTRGITWPLHRLYRSTGFLQPRRGRLHDFGGERSAHRSGQQSPVFCGGLFPRFWERPAASGSGERKPGMRMHAGLLES